MKKPLVLLAIARTEITLKIEVKKLLASENERN